MLCAIYVVLFGSFPLRYLILHMLPSLSLSQWFLQRSHA